MTGHDKEELGRASVRVLKDKGGGSGVDVGSGSGGGDGSGAGDARRLLEVMKVDNVAADEEVVNTLRYADSSPLKSHMKAASAASTGGRY